MLNRKQLSNTGSQVWIILALLLAVSPAIAIGWAILQYGVNVPFWDQWEIARMLVEQAERNLSLEDLLSQHNEHRIVFPRLIFLVLAFLTQWNVKYEMLFTFFLACITSLFIYYLLRLTVSQNPITSLLLVSLANFLIFSPVQYECWLWGFQITFFLPIACLVLSLLITQITISFWLKLLLCISLSTISTFSLANGALSWIILLPVLLLTAEGVKRKNLIKVVAPIWLSCFLINIGIYIHGYQRPASHPEILNIFEQMKVAADYFLVFLGAPLSGGNLVVARAVGCLLISLYVLVCLYIALFRHQPLIKRTSVWLSLGIYPILSAGMATLSRAGFGVEQALSSRYTAITIYLIVALIGLLAIVFSDITTNATVNQLHVVKRLHRQSRRDILQIVMTCLITICLVLGCITALEMVPFVQQVHRDRLYAKTCLTFINFVPDDCIVQYLAPAKSGETRRLGRKVSQSGFIVPPVIDERNIAKIAPAPSVKLGAYGYFDEINPVQQDIYEVSGWAVLPQFHKSADSVLLTYQNTAGEPVLFAIASVRGARPDVAKHLRSDRYRNSGWTASFSVEKLPASQDLVVEAWAFDTERNQAFRLAKQHLLKRS